MLQLPEKIKMLSKDGNKAKFEIYPLMPGYGATIANPLRRVLLSSLMGSAITSIKIKGVEHEFSSIPGILEDLIEIILNIKKIRLKSYSNEPVKLTLSVSGEQEVRAKDIKLTSDVEVINGDQHIATITEKRASLEMELEVEKGIGYIPVEQRKKEKLSIGVIAIDAIFSPVKSVNFSIENIRLGQRIDYNKIIIEIETDGSIQPEKALKDSSEILIDHFKIISTLEVPEEKPKVKAKTIKTTKKTKPKVKANKKTK